MDNERKRILGALSRAIKTGNPIVLKEYRPVPPNSADDRVADAIIADVLRRKEDGDVQIFSGVSDMSLTD